MANKTSRLAIGVHWTVSGISPALHDLTLNTGSMAALRVDQLLQRMPSALATGFAETEPELVHLTVQYYTAICLCSSRTEP